MITKAPTRGIVAAYVSRHCLQDVACVWCIDALQKIVCRPADRKTHRSDCTHHHLLRLPDCCSTPFQSGGL